MATKPLVTQRALCSDGAQAALVFCQALGPLCVDFPALLGREGSGQETPSSGVESAAATGDWGGSPPGGEQSPGERAGVIVVCGSPAERSGVSCPAASC